jgi:hypothetical protein
MAVLTGTEIIVQQIGSWSPSDVAYVRRVSFENCETSSFDLALLLLLQPRQGGSVGWPDPHGKFWESEMGFKGIRDLSLTICGPWDIQTPGFAIEDIRDRQWEGVNLLVYDYEGLTHEEIRFGAKSAEVRSCQPTTSAPHFSITWREYPGEFDRSSESV